jgi:ABC-2 type transport system ATP-binding protein
MNPDIRCFCTFLAKTYGGREVLRGCNLTVQKGEMVGLVGENGSGKSTLVRSLLGFIRPSSGTYWVASSAGYCPQDNYLNRRMTVNEHFNLMREVFGKKHTQDGQFWADLLKRLKLVSYLNTQIGHLSSGTYQKVKFATAIAHRPSMIFLDEPCDGFDWAMYQAFWDIMMLIKAEGSAVLMISHLLYDRERFDRIYELRDGICEQT